MDVPTLIAEINFCFYHKHTGQFMTTPLVIMLKQNVTL